MEVATAELSALRASSSSPSGSSSGCDAADTAHAAASSTELRRLRVELDKKGSEIDTAAKEIETLRAELKEMKAMFNAAEQGADAAGADEGALRKRLSQLMCENGLLKGEKDKREALAASAAAETKGIVSRAAAEVEKLEREVAVQRERADCAAALAADRDGAKAALSAMEARLAELRQERRQLQVRSPWCHTKRGRRICCKLRCLVVCCERCCGVFRLDLFEKGYTFGREGGQDRVVIFAGIFGKSEVGWLFYL